MSPAFYRPEPPEVSSHALQALFITGGYAARRGTRPTFATPQDAEAFDRGYAAYEFGQDCPSDGPERSGWLAADKCYSDDRESRVAGRRERA